MSAIIKSIAIGMLGIMLGCSTQFKPLLRSAPPAPRIRLVEVKEDCVCGESLNNMINNWIDLLQYVEVLKSSGCFQQ